MIMNYPSFFEIAQQIKEVVRKNLGFTVTIGIGGLYDNLLELNNSYNEASKALEYKILMGCDSIIIYDVLDNKKVLVYEIKNVPRELKIGEVYESDGVRYKVEMHNKIYINREDLMEIVLMN